MKQITIKELKEIVGCESNNEFANMLSLYMEYASKENNNRGHKAYGEMLYKCSSKIYNRLKELGYYADLEGGE